jgi:hypothetical protein
MALAGCHTFEFLDLVSPRSVIGVCRENSHCAAFGGFEIAVALPSFVESRW